MSVLFRPSLTLLIGLVLALAAAPSAQVEVRLSGASALLGEGDTQGLVLGVRAETPLVSLTSPTAPVQSHFRVFGGATGLRAGTDFYETAAFAESGGLGYGRRTLLMAEAGLAARVGWVQLAVGPSLRYRLESFVRNSRYNLEMQAYEATVISSERTDIGGAAELAVQLPVSETAALGIHASLRRYDQGTQMAGLGLSGSLAF